jgi:hypothetical protein
MFFFNGGSICSHVPNQISYELYSSVHTLEIVILHALIYKPNHDNLWVPQKDSIVIELHLNTSKFSIFYFPWSYHIHLGPRAQRIYWQKLQQFTEDEQFNLFVAKKLKLWCMWIQMYEKMLRFKRLWIDDDVDMVHVDNINDSKYDFALWEICIPSANCSLRLKISVGDLV